MGNEVKFDDYVESYTTDIQSAINFIGQDVDFFLNIKADLLLKMAEKNWGDVSQIKTLDVGCGIGLIDKLLKTKINHLYGIDVETKVIEKAAENNPSFHYQVYDGRKIPFEENTFDFVFAVNVMHHVPPHLWENFTQEMERVLKPGGVAVVFEHNPFNPLTRKVVKECEFDRDAVLLKQRELMRLYAKAGLEVFNRSYILFFPFKPKIFRKIEEYLKAIPLGAQQYIAGKKKVSSPGCVKNLSFK